MVDFNPINNFREPIKFKETKPQHEQQAAPQKAETAPKPEAAKIPFTVDTPATEVQAAMNKALGFEKSAEKEIDYAKVDKEFRKDPVAFAAKHLAPEVKENAEIASLEFDANATVARTFSPERQAQVIEGFSQRNDSPRAFANEFLELFC